MSSCITLLYSNAIEQFLRLLSILHYAQNILGEAEAQQWLSRKIPALGDQVPLDLLDTEAGHKLIKQVLLQIQHGIYN